jgi:hypothetical protein
MYNVCSAFNRWDNKGDLLKQALYKPVEYPPIKTLSPDGTPVPEISPPANRASMGKLKLQPALLGFSVPVNATEATCGNPASSVSYSDATYGGFWVYANPNAGKTFSIILPPNAAAIDL